ncbi:MAG: hypothetical protein ACPL06_01605, partial [Candidatus Anstonellales archaeon]
LHDFLYVDGIVNEKNLDQAVRAILLFKPNLKDKKPLVIPQTTIVRGGKFFSIGGTIILSEDIEKQLTLYRNAAQIASYLTRRDFKNLKSYMIDLGVSAKKSEEYIAELAGRICAELEAQGRLDEAKKVRDMAREACTTLSSKEFNRLFNRGMFEGFVELGYSFNEAFNMVYGPEGLKEAGIETVFYLSVEFAAEESAKFKEWLEREVNMVELEKAMKEAANKGLEKSSEETKRIVEEAVKALDEIIKGTVDEETKRIAEILRDGLNKFLGMKVEEG